MILRDSAGFHFPQARRAGSRVSKTRYPPGRNARYTPATFRPAGRVSYRLRGVSGHRGKIYAHRRKPRGVAMDPAHPFGVGLGSSDIKRPSRGINPVHFKTQVGER